MATRVPDSRVHRNSPAKAAWSRLESSQHGWRVSIHTTSQSKPDPSILPKRIVLTGFMGAGKSTVGPRLAQELGWSFIDLDDEIVRAEQISIAEIFDSLGESRFRELEQNALAQTLRLENLVLALGGGAIETDINRQRLRDDKETMLIYLAAPLGTLIERCEQQQLQRKSVRRPILEKRAELTERFQRRRPFYELADCTLETSSQTLDQIVATILTLWEKASTNSTRESQRA